MKTTKTLAWAIVDKKGKIVESKMMRNLHIFKSKKDVGFSRLEEGEKVVRVGIETLDK